MVRNLPRVFGMVSFPNILSRGKWKKTEYSSVNLGVTYTEKQQLLVNAKNSVMLKNNKIFLSGDWRFYIFSQANYGLGTDIIPVLPKRTILI